MPNVDNQVNMHGLLRELAKTVPVLMSEAIEARLRIACRARRRHLRLRMTAVGLAACLFLACGWGWYASKRLAIAPENAYAGFMTLPYAQSDVPMEQVVIVRVNLEPADLQILGLPADALTTGRQVSAGLVSADLLIDQGGVARAVRLANYPVRK